MSGSSRDLGATRSTLFRQQIERAPAPRRAGSRAAASIRSGPLGGLGHEADQVHVLQRALRRPLHQLAEPPRARVKPGRVHEDDLGMRQVADPGDPGPRRLRARGRRWPSSRPTSRLSRVDLPTLGRPTSATNPARCAGRGHGRGAARPRAGAGTGRRRARGEDGAGPLVHATGLARAGVVPAGEVEDPVDHEQIQLEGEGARPRAAACRAAVSTETTTSPEQGRRPGAAEVEGEDVGALARCPVAGVEAADGRVVHQRHVHLGPRRPSAARAARAVALQPPARDAHPGLAALERDGHGSRCGGPDMAPALPPTAVNRWAAPGRRRGGVGAAGRGRRRARSPTPGRGAPRRDR